MRNQLGVLLAVLLLALAWRVPAATAAAEVHRFNIVLSAVPTQLRATDFNSVIDYTNQTFLEPSGLEPLERIKFSWLLDAELRYFVRQNLAVSGGVGRIKKVVSQEYLPSIGQSIVVSSHVTSVPLHAGAAYYFRPYNQGDFQARAYVGAGFMSVVYNRASLGVEFAGVSGQVSSGTTGTNDAPGYYGELGAHLFFASRYSVLLSGLYRSNQVRNLVEESSGVLMRDPQGRPLTLDVGGLGFRMAVAIGL
jgi:hypothetical protein